MGKAHIRRILVVDDEIEFGNTIKRHLRREGFILNTACDGKDACCKISDTFKSVKTYDLVITDVMMPKVSGIELLQWIKKNCPEISVLVITDFGDMDAVLETIRPELDDFCQKPVTPAEMVCMISNINLKRDYLSV